MQDITPPERIEENPQCDREVTVYGYLRGANLKPGTQAHLAGVGDMTVSDRNDSPRFSPESCNAAVASQAGYGMSCTKILSGPGCHTL